MKRILLLLILLTARIAVNAQCYSVAPSTYVADTSFQSVGTIVTMTDDHWSDVVPIGFTFCLYGNQYDSVIVGDNGLVSFEIQYALNYCLWPINAAAPSVTMTSMKNAIGVPYQDLHILPNPQQRVYSWTSESAPNRTFTVYYDSIPMYGCGTQHYTGRVILHETSNNIEIHIDNKDLCTSWNSGAAILGIQNQLGTDATVVPSHNWPTQWTETQQAWLITPICNVCTSLVVADRESSELITVYPNPTSGNVTLQIQRANSAITSYDVIDIAGRVIQSAPVNSQQQIQFTLENCGMYFVRVYDEANTMLKSEKIIVE